MNRPGIRKQGTAARTTTGTTAILAAATSSIYYVQKIIVNIGAFADTGTYKITDGTTDFVGLTLCKDGNGAVHVYDFGEEGWQGTSGAAISLTTATANTTVSATVIARLVS